MKLEFYENITVPSTSALLLFFMVLISSTNGDYYDYLCPPSDNPLNIPFTIPQEILVDGKTAEVSPIAIDFMDPRDVACKANHGDVLRVNEMTFKDAVNCQLKDSLTISCEVDERCTTQRKQNLVRLRKVALRVLDEVVLKLKAINFYNKYVGVKRVIYGTEPIANLSGLEIVKRATNGRFNILNGFSVSNRYPTPTRKDFHDVFSKPVQLYAKLLAAPEPTGLHSKPICEKSAKTPADTTNQLFSCYFHFFQAFKKNEQLSDADIRLIELLNESFKYIVEYLSNGAKTFSGVKIPFLGYCNDSKGLEARESFWSLLKAAHYLEECSK